MTSRRPPDARHGTVLRREGVDVHVEADGTLWIGGGTVPTVQGTILA